MNGWAERKLANTEHKPDWQNINLNSRIQTRQQNINQTD